MAHHEALCDCFGSCTSDRLSKYIPSLSHDKQLLETETSSRLPLLAPSNNIPIQVSHLQAVSSLTPLPSLNNSLNTWKIHQIKSLPAASSHGKSSTSSKQSEEGTGMKMRAGEAWCRLRKSWALTLAVRVQTLQVWSKKIPLNNKKPHTWSLAVKACRCQKTSSCLDASSLQLWPISLSSVARLQSQRFEQWQNPEGLAPALLSHASSQIQCGSYCTFNQLPRSSPHTHTHTNKLVF